MHPKVQISEEKNLYQGYISLKQYKLRFRHFDGSWSAWLERQIIQRGDAVVVLPYDPVRDQILMIEQFRMPAYCKDFDPWLLELPAGMVDEGEALDAVGEREMMEETGLPVRDMKLVHSFLPSPGILAEVIHLYVARVDLTPLHNGHELVHGKVEEGENIYLRPIHFNAIEDLLATEQVRNATALLGLYWLLANRYNIKKEWLS